MTASSLGDAFTSVATSLTTTQTEMTDVKTLKQRKVRQVARESRKKASQTMTEASPDDFWIYSASRVKQTVYKEWIEVSVKRKNYIWKNRFSTLMLASWRSRKVPLGKELNALPTDSMHLLHLWILASTALSPAL